MTADRRSTSRRWKIALALLAALVVVAAAVANAVLTSREVAPASADIGYIVDLPGGDLQVREDGPPQAPAIVLLHGFAGSIHWWNGITPLLARDHRVIRIDLLGHGGSAKPREGYAVEHRAELVQQALARVGVERALVVGHSMGGVVATALVERAPALVHGLVLIDSPPNEESGLLPLTARLQFVPVVGQAVRRLATDGLIRNGLAAAFTPGFDVPDQFVRDLRRMTYTSFDLNHSYFLGYLRRAPLNVRLAAQHVPLLVIFGAEDRIVRPSAAQEFTLVPAAEIVTIPGVGHSPHVEAPGRTAAAIIDFATRIQWPRSTHPTSSVVIDLSTDGRL
jgi:pimeloyl-ACP methyl ester carboxylesterase